MFFRKKISSATEKRYKKALCLDFNKYRGDFVKQRNLRLSGDGVAPSISFEQTPYSDEIYRAIFRQNGYLIALKKDQGLCRFNDKWSYSFLGQLTEDGVISHVKYQGATVFSCSRGTYLTVNGIEATEINNNFYPSLAVSGDRLFGVCGNSLSMTEAGDISSWDDTRTVYAHTQLDAVVALDKLYALGDTCYTFSPDAEEIDAKFHPFCYGIGAVQPESVARFDKRAIFATTNGLYQLKNGVITPVFIQLNDFVSFNGCVACAYKGKYVVACKRKNGDASAKDIVLVLDLDTDLVCAVLDVEPQHISTVDGVLYAVFNDKLFYATDGQVEGSFCQKVDFGCSNVKYLDKIAIRTHTDAQVWIGNGAEKRRYDFKGRKTIQTAKLLGSGRAFYVEVQAQDGIKLDYLELFAHSYEV